MLIVSPAGWELAVLMDEPHQTAPPARPEARSTRQGGEELPHSPAVPHRGGQHQLANQPSLITSVHRASTHPGRAKPALLP